MTSEIQRSNVFVPADSSDFTTGERLASAASCGGVGLGADRRGLEPTRAGDDDRPGPHVVAGSVFAIGIGLAGEQRLVDLQPGGLGDDAVGEDLVAGAQLEQVVGDDVLDLDLGDVAVPHDPSAAAR